jgi:hypothetical protein
LKRRHQGEADEDVADRVWAIFGTAVHDVLRRAQGTEDQLQENWLSVPIVGDYELSGIFDLYDDSTGTVTDYKTAGTIKWLKREFDDYRQQVLAYCWMLRENGFDARNGEVVMLLRDWSKSKARFDKDYPKHQVQKVSWSFEDSDFEAIEGHIMRWFAAVTQQEKLSDEKLEPCSPDQRWHRDDKWAVKKEGRKTAVRVYDNKNDAYQRAAGENRQAGKDDLFYVEFREGEDTKCSGYCPVAQFCPHGRRIIGTE